MFHPKNEPNDATKKPYKLSIWDKAYRQILGDLIPDGCNESFPDLQVESGPRFVGSGPPLYNPKNFTSRIAGWKFCVFILQVFRTFVFTTHGHEKIDVPLCPSWFPKNIHSTEWNRVNRYPSRASDDLYGCGIGVDFRLVSDLSWPSPFDLDIPFLPPPFPMVLLRYLPWV